MSHPDDIQLQRLLDGDSELSDAYRALPKDHPPAALDAAILAAARAEAQRPTRPTWLVPLSLAATIVLGVGLSVRQLTPPSTRMPDSLSDAASQSFQGPEEMPAPHFEVRQEQTADAPSNGTRGKPSEDAFRIQPERAAAKRDMLANEMVDNGRIAGALAADDHAPRQAPAAALPVTKSTRAQVALSDDADTNRSANPPRTPAAAAPAAPTEPRPMAAFSDAPDTLAATLARESRGDSVNAEAVSRAPSTHAQANAHAPTRQREPRQHDEAGKEDPTLGFAPPPPSPSPARVAEEMRHAAQDKALAASAEEKRLATTGYASDNPAMASSSALNHRGPDDMATREADGIVIVTETGLQVYPRANADTAPDAEKTAKKRLEEIRERHEAGDEAEAERLFGEFVKDFPDYELPTTFPYPRR